MTNMTKTTKTIANRRGDTFSVYFAGDLWTHKDLIGNALLADYIRTVSRGRYFCVLPQDLEEPVHRTVDIRNVDLKHVMTSDLAIFNFDGANLDSGTVVEFIYAKMLDVPCVLLRTDFRAAGEGNADQDPWNLMASHWPRSRVVKLHGMVEYQNAKKAAEGACPSGSTKSLRNGIDRMYRQMAKQIVEGLDAVRSEQPLADKERIASLFDWAVRCPGAGYDGLFSATEVADLIKAKAAKRLLAA